MSTFTDWNGPQGNSINGLRNADLISLTKAYNEVLNALNQKQDKLTIDESLSEISDNPVKNKSIASAVNALKEAVNDIDAAMEEERKLRLKGDQENVGLLDTVAKTLEDSFKLLENNTKAALEKADAALKQLDEYFGFEDDGLLVKKALKITAYVLESAYIDFNKLTAFRASLVTVDNEQPAFLLGMLSYKWEPTESHEEINKDYKTKAGRAFLKFVNSKSFDALVDMSASFSGEEWKGAISATSSNASALQNLRLRLLSGSDSSGNKHVWLAILSDSWTAANPAFYQDLYFYATGINFYPVSSEGYKAPNDVTELIAEASLGNGLSTSALSVDKLTDAAGNVLLQIKTVGTSKRLLLGNEFLKGIVFYTRPYYKTSPMLSLEDMKNAIDEVGTILGWSKFDEDGNCVDLPSNYLPCDGSEFSEEDYPELYRLLEGKLPLVDYHVIKARYGADLHDLPETAGQSLEYVIARLHGIKVYKRIDDVPSSHHVGEPVIIRDVDPVTGDYEYYVMVKTETGWEEYNTTFDDYEKTIESIASVIATLHGSDVYTLYDDADNLPPTAEEGQLAIIIKDSVISVYKFVQDKWEQQR